MTAVAVTLLKTAVIAATIGRIPTLTVTPPFQARQTPHPEGLLPAVHRLPGPNIYPRIFQSASATLACRPVTPVRPAVASAATPRLRCGLYLRQRNAIMFRSVGDRSLPDQIRRPNCLYLSRLIEHEMSTFPNTSQIVPRVLMPAPVGKDVRWDYRRATFRKPKFRGNLMLSLIRASASCTNASPRHSRAKQRALSGPICTADI